MFACIVNAVSKPKRSLWDWILMPITEMTHLIQYQKRNGHIFDVKRWQCAHQARATDSSHCNNNNKNTMHSLLYDCFSNLTKFFSSSMKLGLCISMHLKIFGFLLDFQDTVKTQINCQAQMKRIISKDFTLTHNTSKVEQGTNEKSIERIFERRMSVLCALLLHKETK